MLLATLLACSPQRGRAADQLEVRLDGLRLPVDLHQLADWSRNPSGRGNEFGFWFDLLDHRSRDDLISLLRSPLLEDRGLALQLLKSWAGRQVLNELGQLLNTGQRDSGTLLVNTLRQLLQQPRPVTVVDLLLAVPSERLTLNLDALLQLAQQWRHQLDIQAVALQRLRQLPLPERDGSAAFRRQSVLYPPVPPRSLSLAVAHRAAPLTLQLWPAAEPRQRSFVLLMPGLGGSGAQLSWLARGLASRGWTVLLLEDPGSDERAVRQLLDGRRPAPGAETLPDRLADVDAVLLAERDGRLPRLGDSVVLMGHSLGALAAMLAAGARPEPGLENRCTRALSGIPLINLSRLVQCQVPEVALPPATVAGQKQAHERAPLAAVVSLNGFGSLLWPNRGLSGLGIPLLMVGGSLDLVTPPVSEQLALFQQSPNSRSRLVVVEGASHFSVVRITDPEAAVLNLGKGLVGLEPIKVQNLLLTVITEFLRSVDDPPAPLPPQRRSQQGVTAAVLDPVWARRWQAAIRR